MFLIEFWGQKFKGQAHWTSKYKFGFRALEHSPAHLGSPYHTYGLHYQIWGQKVKGKAQWTLKLLYDIRALERYPFHL
jgi:hypothetical protein